MCSLLESKKKKNYKKNWDNEIIERKTHRILSHAIYELNLKNQTSDYIVVEERFL